MIYFAPPHKAAVPHMVDGTIGWIDTPDQCNQGNRPDGVIWIADNGCFGKKKFSEERWFSWLQSHSDIQNCLFATAPDVVGDAAATLERSRPWLSKIRALGYPAAFVAQDGIENTDVPWDEFDCLFIGGSNEFKLGPVAARFISAAKKLGKWVHVGRVNSHKRMRAMEALGADSVDGTNLIYEPSRNLGNLLHWVADLKRQQPIFELEVGMDR